MTSRRKVLATSVVALTALAGCSTNNSNDTNTPTSTPRETPRRVTPEPTTEPEPENERLDYDINDPTQVQQRIQRQEKRYLETKLEMMREPFRDLFYQIESDLDNKNVPEKINHITSEVVDTWNQHKSTDASTGAGIAKTIGNLHTDRNNEHQTKYTSGAAVGEPHGMLPLIIDPEEGYYEGDMQRNIAGPKHERPYQKGYQDVGGLGHDPIHHYAETQEKDISGYITGISNQVWPGATNLEYDELINDGMRIPGHTEITQGVQEDIAEELTTPGHEDSEQIIEFAKMLEHQLYREPTKQHILETDSWKDVKNALNSDQQNYHAIKELTESKASEPGS